jgi:hypothetical protein
MSMSYGTVLHPVKVEFETVIGTQEGTLKRSPGSAFGFQAVNASIY